MLKGSWGWRQSLPLNIEHPQVQICKLVGVARSQQPSQVWYLGAEPLDILKTSSLEQESCFGLLMWEFPKSGSQLVTPKWSGSTRNHILSILSLKGAWVRGESLPNYAHNSQIGSLTPKSPAGHSTCELLSRMPWHIWEFAKFKGPMIAPKTVKL